MVQDAVEDRRRDDAIAEDVAPAAEGLVNPDYSWYPAEAPAIHRATGLYDKKIVTSAGRRCPRLRFFAETRKRDDSDDPVARPKPSF